MADLLARLLPYEKLTDQARLGEWAEAYQKATPYPHIVIDDLFDEDVLNRIVEEFPAPETFSKRFNNQREVKHGTGSESEIPAFARTFIHALNSGSFINFLEAVTNIKGLVADPHLVGGGLHVLRRGGKLAVHTDFNFHKKIRLDRRVNVLLYLNRDWKDAYGGYFEAWRPNGTQAEARILPIFNRLVIFNTNDFTFHGNPDPVACPEGDFRKSIAMYYYTNGRPDEEWSGLVQTTQFMNRPGEAILEREALHWRAIRAMPKFARVWFSRQFYAKR